MRFLTIISTEEIYIIYNCFINIAYKSNDIIYWYILFNNGIQSYFKA